MKVKGKECYEGWSQRLSLDSRYVFSSAWLNSGF